MEKIVTRMGDGSRIEMSAAEIQEELETGARDAAERARVPNLNDDEITYLLDLYRCKDRVVGVEQGERRHLLEMADAFRTVASLPRCADGRQDQRCEDADDGNNYEQLDQREPLLPRHLHISAPMAAYPNIHGRMF